LKKALLLLSGGFDSPIAGLLAQKQGFEVNAIHFSFMPLTDDSALKKSIKIAEKLKFKKFFEVPFADALEEIVKKTERKAYFVLMKRLMLKIAEKIALKEKIDVLITGESLAQVSSQTLDNLSIITKAVKIPVLRPLIALTKEEIINLSRKHELFDLSKGPEMCDPFAVKKPYTKAKEEKILAEEKKLNLKKIINKTIKKIKEKKLEK